MPSIAFVHTEYLGLTETFIYEEISNLKKYGSIVLTQTPQNIGVFPHKNIIILTEGPWKLRFNENLSAKKPYESVKKLKHYRQAEKYYRNLIEKYDVRLLHAEYGMEGVYALPIKTSFNLPLVTSFRGYDLYLEPGRSPGVYDELFEEGDLFLFRSTSMLEDALKLGCPKKKCRVQHSGIDTKKIPFKERDQLKEDEPIKLLFVGRFVEKKAPLLAVEVFTRLCEVYGNLEFTMIGDGSLFKETKGMVKKCGLEGKVHLPGFVPYADVVCEMLSSHIFFMPFQTASDGDKEGIPNSLKEASATGMPVVSTFHSGITEAVIDGKTGLLAPEGDIDGLVEKLSHLIDNPDLWNDLGQAGHKLMEEEFDIRKETQKLERFYEELIR